MKRIIFCIILLLALLYLYGSYVEPKLLKINEYTISIDGIPDSFKELKIVHFSDVLYNKNEKFLEKIKNQINKQEADIIIFTGDLFSNGFKYSEEDFDYLKESLKDLEASLYKYAIIGDNDKKHLEKYKDILYESDFILLNNESNLLFYKDKTPINIIGLTNYKVNEFKELQEKDVDYDVNIVMTHKPTVIDKIKNEDIDLILAGHSLGGYINIPFYGGLIRRTGTSKYLNNYYKINDTDLFISNGLGYENVNFRLFNTPSINVYRFK